jgi:hypothetical protein
MDWVRIVLSRCRDPFHRRKLDADLDEELRSHIDLAIEESLERGKSEQGARTAALRDSGGVSQVAERYRVQRGLTLFLKASTLASTTFVSPMNAPRQLRIRMTVSCQRFVNSGTAAFTLLRMPLRRHSRKSKHQTKM